MTSGALDVTNSNMAAPLLARSIGEFMFAAISAIAFTTVLGTVWRRTPLRRLRDPCEHQVTHYGIRPTEPTQGDWLLGGACLLLRVRELDTIRSLSSRFRRR